ncbi:MAG: DUF3842 family protein [Desulfarculaceae bacterium]|nr:DUF3842 family protein [Desulfarculaceae bacterium]
MVVAVVDGQGGGIGSAIIQVMRRRLGPDIEVWALGTNAVATAQMMRAGANKGATGEQAVIRGVARAQVILGPISIVLARSFMGEVTPATAAAVAGSFARKLLLPLTQENVEVVGVQKQPLPHHVEALMDKLQEVQANV